ncbi:heterokaryon incompatibility, partial [Xylariales sp. PMI_506]
MRLLKVEGDGNFDFTKNLTDEIPPYAILSHTWGAEEDEVTYADIINKIQDKPGFEKLKFCAEQAGFDGLDHFWVDTCCIDRSSSAELSTSINSMFRWYQRAAKCYVYLSDVAYDSHSTSQWKSQFRKSRWFTRGWTLQELMAPSAVEFFSVERKRLGDKDSLEHEIAEITGISPQALRGQQLSSISSTERTSWLAQRQTKLAEDMAYCLFGILDVYMPPIYGEGMHNALRRLREEVKK